MPTYEYECPDCGPFSDVRPMVEFDQPQPCPDCGATAARLLACTAIAGGAAEPTSAAPARSHPGGCACCMAPRRFSADAV